MTAAREGIETKAATPAPASPIKQEAITADRPYRCPCYPIVPLLYLVLPTFILTNMFRNQLTESLVGLGFMGLGAAVYCCFLRNKAPARQ